MKLVSPLAVAAGIAPEHGPAIIVPADIAFRLAAAVQEGSAWAAQHTGGAADAYDKGVLGGMAPPPSGAAAATDLARVRDAMHDRTKDGEKLTRELADDGGMARYWKPALDDIARSAGADQARRAAALLDLAQQRADAVADGAKSQFARQRPWQVDSSITTLVKKGHAGESYPSGHSTAAFAAALVLAAFLPAQRNELLADAATVAWSRVYAGVHFPSDIAAGARLASAVSADVLRRAGA